MSEALLQTKEIAVLAFPKTSFEKIEFMAEGFHSKAYLLDNRYVLRVGQTMQAQSGYLREVNLMPLISRNIKVAVPLPCYAMYNGTPLSLHEKVEGTDLHHFNDDPFYVSETLAIDIAKFLRDLHSTLIDKEKEKYLSPLDLMVEFPERNVKMSGEYLNISLTVSRRYEEYISETVRLSNNGKVLVHADFNHANMLINENGRLCGVIDFGELSLQMPEIDFSALIKSHPFLTTRVMDCYEEISGKKINRRYVWLMATLRAYNGLALALESKQEKRIKHNLKRLQVLNLLKEYVDE